MIILKVFVGYYNLTKKSKVIGRF